MKYQFSTLKDLQELLQTEQLEFDEYLLKREAFLSNKSPDVVTIELDRRIVITREALIRGLSEPQRSRSGLTNGAAYAYLRNTNRLLKEPLYHRAIAYALAINEVNACGGKVVAFPTAGSSGIVPGVIWAYWDTLRSGSAECTIPSKMEPPFGRPLRAAFSWRASWGSLLPRVQPWLVRRGAARPSAGPQGQWRRQPWPTCMGLP
jgi:L-serine dehydratase